MAKKTRSGEVNKSAEIRELLEKNPQLKVGEVIELLGMKGIEIKPNLYYFIKGKNDGPQRSA